MKRLLICTLLSAMTLTACVKKTVTPVVNDVTSGDVTAGDISFISPASFLGTWYTYGSENPIFDDSYYQFSEDGTLTYTYKSIEDGNLLKVDGLKTTWQRTAEDSVSFEGATYKFTANETALQLTKEDGTVINLKAYSGDYWSSEGTFREDLVGEWYNTEDQSVLYLGGDQNAEWGDLKGHWSVDGETLMLADGRFHYELSNGILQILIPEEETIATFTKGAPVAVEIPEDATEFGAD